MGTSRTARVLATLLVTLRVLAALVALAVAVQLVRGGPLGVRQLLTAPRSIGAVMVASTTAPEPAGPPLGRRALRLELQRLLIHDTTLTIRFMRATVGGDPAFVDAANALVVRSADELEQTLRRAVPTGTATDLTEVSSAPTGGLFGYATALRDGDDAAREEHRAALAAAAGTEGARLEDLTGGAIPQDAAITALQMRNDLLLYQVEAYAGGDHEQAYALAHEAEVHAASLAAMLAAGATGQDPRTVEVSTGEQVRADIGRLLAEHASLTTDTLRAGVRGSDEFVAATDALDTNSRALSDLFAATLGQHRARKLSKLWSTNVDQHLRYALAVADQDPETRRKLRDRLRTTAERVGAGLQQASGGDLDATVMATALRSQQVLQLDQIDAYARADYAAATDAAATAHHRSAELARMLGGPLADAAGGRTPQGGADTGGGGTAGTG